MSLSSPLSAQVETTPEPTAGSWSPENVEATPTAKDYAAQVLQHWFIGEQVAEEAWCLEMVERVQSASCAGGLSDLDRHFERYLEREIPQKS